MTSTVFENDSAVLWYHEDTKIIHHQIKKYVYGQSLYDLLNKGTEHMIKTGAVKWLSDDRANNALMAEDNQWTESVWVPKTIKAGWKYWAIVKPEKTTGQINMKNNANTLGNLGVVVKTFNNPDEAMKWLEMQK